MKQTTLILASLLITHIMWGGPLLQIESSQTNGHLTKENILDLDINDLKVGQVITIDQLYFAADESEIEANSHQVLEELYQFMSTHQEVHIEVGGHTNTIPPHLYCDKLSNDRAEAVANYLINKGLDKDRISSKGYGKRQPIVSLSPDSRKKNQRVQIKIMSL